VKKKIGKKFLYLKEKRKAAYNEREVVYFGILPSQMLGNEPF